MKLETAADVSSLMAVHFPSAALTAALERELFWRFDSRPQSVEAMAESLDISPGICRNWLRTLSSLGLLEELADGYALSGAAQEAIINSHDSLTWSHLASEEREKWPCDLALINQLYEPGSVERQIEHSPGELRDYVQAMADEPQRAYRFTHMLYDLHRQLAEDVARQLPYEGAKRLLDIGGGSGVVSLTLLSKYPELTATVVDIPNVCAVGRQIADGTHEARRITYHPANYYLDEFPGSFDLILACDILGCDQVLIDKVSASLEIGGRFVIIDRWFEERRDWTIGQSSYLLRRSLQDPGFSLPSIDEVYSRLRSAGLEPIRREEIPYGRWQMIQARRHT